MKKLAKKSLTYLGYCDKCGRDVAVDYCDHCQRFTQTKPTPKRKRTNRRRA